jgi:hypothetical protein
MQLDPTLTEKLYSDFPRLFRGRHKPAQESSMCWGFECGDGWYQLLHGLSIQLSNYLAEHPDSNLEAIQVKSKFGRLCFHLSDYDAVVEEMINAARERAAATCEITGRPGQLCRGKSRRDPLMVLCPEKAEEFGYSVVIR